MTYTIEKIGNLYAVVSSDPAADLVAFKTKKAATNHLAIIIRADAARKKNEADTRKFRLEAAASYLKARANRAVKPIQLSLI